MKTQCTAVLPVMASAIVIGLAVGAAHAETINLATGLDASGQLQTNGDALDANWQVLGGASPLMSPNAYVVGVNSPDGGFWQWPLNGPYSSWIAANPDDPYGNGYMTFIRKFWVSSPGTASIVGGAWAIDDAGALALNGNPLSNLPFENFGSLHPFSTVPGDFWYGWNTLVMAVTWSDIGVDGARLQGTLIDVGGTTIPESSTWAMMLLGLAGLGFAGYRRARADRTAFVG
jgi:hypothetical protein